MTFRLGSLKQYWFIGLVALYVVVAVVLLLISNLPKVLCTFSMQQNCYQGASSPCLMPV